MEKTVLLSDIDLTLLGDNRALKSLNTKLIQIKNKMLIIYATARTKRSVKRLIEKGILITPDHAICAMGTEIIHFPKGLDREWQNQMGRNWEGDKIKALQKKIPGIRLKPWQMQAEMMLLYSTKQNGADIDEMQRIIDKNSISAKVVKLRYSDRAIIPVNAGKSQAVRYLLEQFRNESSRIIACGDSYSDSDLFDIAHDKIIVGNAEKTLILKYKNRAVLTNASFASGVEEGLKRLNIL
jgi:sucrose-6F-phosphate phosphohydrolase